MPKAIPPHVLEVLKKSTITETLLVLPCQLERKTYTDTAAIIALAGGKWNRKAGGFLFNADPREKLGLALEKGAIRDEKKERQAFYTPESIANDVAMFADVGGRTVLEPSAGDGGLVKALLSHGATTVLCIELEEACRKPLMELGQAVMIADFLTLSPHRTFSRIVMNPPFTKGQYHKHVAHALTWLAAGGSLFAVVPDNECPKLAALGAIHVEKFPAGSFKEAGTMIATRLIRIDKPAADRPRRR